MSATEESSTLVFEYFNLMEEPNLNKGPYHTQSQMSTIHPGLQWSSLAGMIIQNPSTDHQETSKFSPQAKVCSQHSFSALLNLSHVPKGTKTKHPSHNPLSRQGESSTLMRLLT